MNTGLSNSTAHRPPVPLGMPTIGVAVAAERQARIETRRAFVEMKQSYMSAASDITGPTAGALASKVRSASEPWELWSLRAVILASLADDHARTAGHRRRLERAFDSLFNASGS